MLVGRTLVASVCTLVDDAKREQVVVNAASEVATCPRRQLADWLDARRAASLAGVPEIPIVRGRRRVLSSIAALANAPSSARHAAAPAASHALSLASNPLPASIERTLTGGASLPSDLTALATRPTRRAGSRAVDCILALIVLVP